MAALDEWAGNRIENSPGKASEETELELFTRLCNCAPRWSVVLRFKAMDAMPNAVVFSADTLIDVYRKKQINRATLLAGVSATKKIAHTLPSPFYRTFDFLLDMVKCGRTYIPITDKDLLRGLPKPGWCKLPAFTTVVEDEKAGTELMNKLAAVDRETIWHLLSQARAWCFVYNYVDRQDSVKCAMNVTRETMFRQYEEKEINEWTPVVGLLEDKQARLWVPPSVLVPFGCLLAMHQSGRHYLPLFSSDLKACQHQGYMHLATRQISSVETALEKLYQEQEQQQQQQQQQQQWKPKALVSTKERGRTPHLRTPTAPLPPAAAANVQNGHTARHADVTSAANPLNFDHILDSTRPARPQGGCFETALFRLFLGQQGQNALRSNWWYCTPEDKAVQGPFSTEQMVLASVAGLFTLSTLVCGTDNFVFPPLYPPSFVFQPLSELLQHVASGGDYSIVCHAMVVELVGSWSENPVVSDQPQQLLEVKVEENHTWQQPQHNLYPAPEEAFMQQQQPVSLPLPVPSPAAVVPFEYAIPSNDIDSVKQAEAEVDEQSDDDKGFEEFLGMLLPVPLPSSQA